VSGADGEPPFELLHRPLAMLAHAIAGRPLRLVPSALSATAARPPRLADDPGTLHVPARAGAPMPREAAERMLRLGVLRQALRAADDAPARAPSPPRGATRTRPVLLERVFVLLEGARIDARLRRDCPGAVPDLEQADAIARARLVGSAAGGPIRDVIRALAIEALRPPRPIDAGGVPDAGLGLVRPDDGPDVHPDADPGLVALQAMLPAEVSPLRAVGATRADALAVARRIAARIEAAARPARAARGPMLRIVAPEVDAARHGPQDGRTDDGTSQRADGEAPRSADAGEAGADGHGSTDAAGVVAGAGRPGEGHGAAPQAAALAEPSGEDTPALDAFGRPRRARRLEPALRPLPGGVLHDEWDWTASRHLRAWCRVNESRLRGTDTGFGDDVRARHPELWRTLRRRLAALRPSGRRRVRGVGDGDELDLDGVVAAVIDRRAGFAGDERAYLRHDPVVRDVAAAFLVDMSASTAVALPESDAAPRPQTEPAPWVDTGALLYGLYDDPPEPVRSTPRRRVIDVAKDALVLMADTLDALGDACALYGFSGDGRDNVEFLVAKAFDDPLSGSTWAALAAMEPRGSTRMGAAIRHATAKLARQPASTRLLVVVSDGYPQDSDYGPDRLDPEYGIRDTARALADAGLAGITTFCVTIDPGGHDYLRRMCAPHRYRVIDDVPALPAALAGIYAELSGRG
jgi:nitric oxide reductase NorD protein